MKEPWAASAQDNFLLLLADGRAELVANPNPDVLVGSGTVFFLNFECPSDRIQGENRYTFVAIEVIMIKAFLLKFI